MGREQARYWMLLLLFFVGVAVSSLESRTQAIVAPSGRTLFNRATLVRSFVEIDHLSVRTEGNSMDVTRYITPLAVVYGFYPKWSVIVAQPYVTVDWTRRMGNETRFLDAWLARWLAHSVRGLENYVTRLDHLTHAGDAIKVFCEVADL